MFSAKEVLVLRCTCFFFVSFFGLQDCSISEYSGSIGQYAEKPDYLTNITVENVVIERPAYTGVGLGQGSGSGVYFK